MVWAGDRAAVNHSSVIDRSDIDLPRGGTNEAGRGRGCSPPVVKILAPSLCLPAENKKQLRNSFYDVFGAAKHYSLNILFKNTTTRNC